MTYEVIFEKFLQHVLVFNAKDTYNCYSNHLYNLLKWFGSLDPRELNYDLLTSYVVYSKNHNISNATINKRLRIMKQAFKHSKIKNGDLYDFPKLKEIDKRFNALTLTEVKTLLNYLDNSTLSCQNKAILAVFLYCGVRLSELIDIKAKNVNFEGNFILLEHTKTYRQRYVFFTEECKQKYLMSYFETLNDIESFLFNVSKDSISSLFRRVKTKLGFVKFSPHVLRHTYATLLVANNVNLSFIATTLGHSSLEMTKRYIHQDLQNQKKIYEQYFNVSV